MGRHTRKRTSHYNRYDRRYWDRGRWRRGGWRVNNYQCTFTVDPNEQWERIESAGKVQTTWQYKIQIVEPQAGLNRFIYNFRCVLKKQNVARDVTYAIVKEIRGYPPQPIVFPWGEDRAVYPPSSLWAMGTMHKSGDTPVYVGTQSGTIHYNQRLLPNDSFWIIFASTSEPHGLQIHASVSYSIQYAI